MATAALVAEGGALRLTGELTALTVPQLYREGRAAIERAGGASLEMDLAGVTRADSAGVALLIDWLAYSGQRGCTLRYAHLPASVEALAGLSEVMPLLRP